MIERMKLMSRFCQNCGTLVEDNAAFCNNCGAQMTDGYPEDPATVSAGSNPYAYTPQPAQPVQQPSYQQPAQQSYYQQPVQQQAYYQQPQPQNTYPYQQAAYAPVQQPKKKKTGLIITISVVAVLLIAAAVLLVILPLVGVDVFGLNWFNTAKQNTPAECVETFIEELADNNIDGALDCIYETKYSDLMRSVMKTQLSSNSDLSGVLGEAKAIGKDNIKKMLEVTVSEEEPLSESDLAECKQELSAMTIPVDKIETIEKANVKMVNKQKNTDQESTFYFVKAEGKWYILAIGMSGALM